MRKMCDIIKVLRTIERCGDKSERTIAKRMLNGLYGEQECKGEIERITLWQFLKTINNKYISLHLSVNQTYHGIPCIADLGHFNIVNDKDIFATIVLVKDDNTFAPEELYWEYIEKIERNPVTMRVDILLTDKYYFDADNVNGGQNGSND